MHNNEINYQFVNKGSKHYDCAAEMRYRVFFEPSGTPMSAVFDSIEDKSYHLVAISEERVVGYIRLTIEGDLGQISQFVVEPSMQGKSGIAKNLFNYLVLRAKENNVKKLWGEIRLHVAKAAAIYGFTVSEDIIFSKKTGIPHRRIEKLL